ncbi:MAG: hypothetical protein LBU61_03180 [Coriobacteriales bacterium]|jgi:hypothetical protein|nr:hypothetical protein [Coriobacteriales bacterium]
MPLLVACQLRLTSLLENEIEQLDLEQVLPDPGVVTTPIVSTPDSGLRYGPSSIKYVPEITSIEDLESFVRWATADSMFYVFPIDDKAEDMQVSIVTNGEDTWAIACFGRNGSNHGSLYNGIYVWRVKVTPSDSKIVYGTISYAFWFRGALSPGIEVEIRQYDNKYLLTGSLGSRHWIPAQEVPGVDRFIDLMQTNYIIIETQSGTQKVQIDNSQGFSAFACILDCEPTDISLFDEQGVLILKLSDTYIEFQYSEDWCPPHLAPSYLWIDTR